MIQLGFLGLGQRHVRLAIIGARIDPTRVQPQGVEVVRQVVVKLDLLGVLFLGMTPDGGQVLDDGGQPACLGRIDRRSWQDIGGQLHQIPHGPLKIHTPFHVGLAQLSGLSGSQLRQSGIVFDCQMNRCVGCTDLLPIGQGQSNRDAELI